MPKHHDLSHGHDIKYGDACSLKCTEAYLGQRSDYVSWLYWVEAYAILCPLASHDPCHLVNGSCNTDYYLASQESWLLDFLNKIHVRRLMWTPNALQTLKAGKGMQSTCWQSRPETCHRTDASIYCYRESQLVTGCWGDSYAMAGRTHLVLYKAVMQQIRQMEAPKLMGLPNENVRKFTRVRW